MRKLLLTLSALLLTLGLSAQTFEWGTATWNIENGKVFGGIDELSAQGVTLTYSNPNAFFLTPLNIVEVEYNLFIDDTTEAIQSSATAQGDVTVTFNYPFVEGHKYKIVTTKSKLVTINIATRTEETVSESNDSYTISFTVQGPELVKTIDVEAYQALTIVDQNAQLTYSLIDTLEVLNVLGANSTGELVIYGLNKNGSYNSYFGENWYDGWRDADGEYTKYNGGWDQIAGHNAYPAVYSIKISNRADSVYYYFYDYWKEYSDGDTGTVDGSTVNGSRKRAPETSYNSIIWEWDNGDGTTTKYTRSYRVDEGKDYKASFAIIANKKYVQVNATLHFVSQEDYAALQSTDKKYEGFVAVGTSMPQQPGVPVAGLSTEAQTVTISAADEEGKANVTFSGFNVAVPPLTIETLTIPVSIREENGSIVYSTEEPVQVAIPMGAMSLNYTATLKGEQTSADSAPVFVLTLSQATVITVVFDSTAELATEHANAEYQIVAGVESVKAATIVSSKYNANGMNLGNATSRGLKIVKLSDGTTRKVVVK